MDALGTRGPADGRSVRMEVEPNPTVPREEGRDPTVRMEFGGPEEPVQAGPFHVGTSYRGHYIPSACSDKGLEKSMRCFNAMKPWLVRLITRNIDGDLTQRDVQQYRINVNLENQTIDYWGPGDPDDMQPHTMSFKPQPGDHPDILELKKTICVVAGRTYSMDAYERSYMGCKSHENGLLHLDPKSRGKLAKAEDVNFFASSDHLLKVNPDLRTNRVAAINTVHRLYAVALVHKRMSDAVDGEIVRLERRKMELDGQVRAAGEPGSAPVAQAVTDELRAIPKTLAVLYEKRKEFAEAQCKALYLQRTFEIKHERELRGKSDIEKAHLFDRWIKEYLKDISDVSYERRGWTLFKQHHELDQGQNDWAAEVSSLAIIRNDLDYAEYRASKGLDPKANTGIEGRVIRDITSDAHLPDVATDREEARADWLELMAHTFDVDLDTFTNLDRARLQAQDEIRDLWRAMAQPRDGETGELAIEFCRDLGQQALNRNLGRPGQNNQGQHVEPPVGSPPPHVGGSPVGSPPPHVGAPPVGSTPPAHADHPPGD